VKADLDKCLRSILLESFLGWPNSGTQSIDRIQKSGDGRMIELENALEQLETELGIVRPLGGMGLPFGLRYKDVLKHVQGKLCPRANDIRATLQRPGTDIFTIIADFIASEITSTPFVFTTLARYVALYGLERFCADPAGIAQHPSRE
jgi:hypothetical protein